MKSRLILTASILIPFFHILFFVWNTGNGIVFRDDMYLIKGSVVEKFCDGTLRFADLWRPTGGSRLLGYNLLLLLNTAWCRLNSRPIVLLIPLVLLATSFLLYKDYQKSLAGLCSPALIACTYSIPMLLLFNLIMWEGLTFDYAINFVWSVPWFIASFHALKCFVQNGGRSSFLIAIVTSGLALLVFGQASSFAFGAALTLTLGCGITLNRQQQPKGLFFRALEGAAMLVAFFFLYLYRIADNDYFPRTQYMDWHIFAKLWDVLRFILVTLSASVLGLDVFKQYFSLGAIVAFGLVIALVYLLAAIVYFRERMYQRTYLPFFMIAYALAFVVLVAVGRVRYGVWYGIESSSRYACSTICGIIAIVWISLFMLAKPAATRPARRSAAAIIVFLLAGMGWTTIVEWRIQPSRRNTFERLHEIALRADTASDEELADFEERPSLIRDSLQVLKEFRLNVYRTEPRASMMKLSLPAGGASSTSTSSVSRATRSGYATLECDTAQALSATALFRLVQNGVAISESAVPAATPTKKARIFVEYGSSAGEGTKFLTINTGLALVNCGPTAAHATYTLRNHAGEILTTGHGSIESRTHFARFVNQLTDVAPDFNFPSNFSTEAQMGSIEIAADQPLAIVALRQTNNQKGETTSTTAPVADLARPLNNRPAYFPQLVDGGGYATSFNLMNTSNAVERGVFQLFDASGMPMSINQRKGNADLHRYSIPPGGIFHFQTDGKPAAARKGWMVLTPDSGAETPIGASLIRHRAPGMMVTESGVPAVEPATHVRIYVDLRQIHNSPVAMANIAGTAVNISIKAFQLDGITAAGTGNLLSLAGHAQITKFVEDLMPGLTVGFRGVLDISSSKPFAVLALHSQKNKRNNLLLTAMPVADFDRKMSFPIVFPHVADGGGYRTEFILLNAGSRLNATIRFFGELGEPVAFVSPGEN